MGEIGLIAAYVIPLVLLGWIWLGVRGRLVLKLGISVLLPVIYIFHWHALQDYQGWPAREKLPEKFILIAADIIEPRRDESRKPAIYLWVKPEGAEHPRAFVMDYTREIHQMLHEVRERMKQGKRQMGILREGKRVGDSGTPVGHGQRIEFVDAPRTTLPPKN